MLTENSFKSGKPRNLNFRGNRDRCNFTDFMLLEWVIDPLAALSAASPVTLFLILRIFLGIDQSNSNIGNNAKEKLKNALDSQLL